MRGNWHQSAFRANLLALRSMRVLALAVALGSLSVPKQADAQFTYRCQGEPTATARANMRPVEFFICMDPALNALHEEANSAYLGRRFNVSGSLSDRLEREHQRWLGGRASSCGVRGDINVLGEASRTAARACLERLYTARILELRTPPIQLRFSANDQLCVPLRDALIDTAKKWTSFVTFFSEFDSLAAKAGLSDVDWLYDPSATGTTNDARGFSAPNGIRAFLEDFGDGVQRIVVMDYVGYGRSAVGNYFSRIFLLKPYVQADRNQLPESIRLLSSERSTPVSGLEIVEREYIKLTRSEVGGQIETYTEGTRYEWCDVCSLKQDAFVFNGGVYFIATSEPFFGSSIVFKITKNLEREVVCVNVPGASVN